MSVERKRAREDEEEEVKDGVKRQKTANDVDEFIKDINHPKLFVERKRMESENLICTICSHVVYPPVDLECGHLFCLACIRHHLDACARSVGVEDAPMRPACPNCRAAITCTMDQLRVSNSWKLKLDNVQCFCPFAFDGAFEEPSGMGKCAWIGPKADLKAHIEKCPAQIDECKQCGQRMQFVDLHSHQQTTCPQRRIKCLLNCGTLLRSHEIKSHMDRDCPLAPAPCPNNCKSMVKLVRSTIQHHIDNECPLQIISCPFLCGVQIQRELVEEHTTSFNFASQHLQAMSLKISALQSEISAYREQFSAWSSDSRASSPIVSAHPTAPLATLAISPNEIKKLVVDVCLSVNDDGVWRLGIIKKEEKERVLIRYCHFSARYDEWIPKTSNRLRFLAPAMRSLRHFQEFIETLRQGALVLYYQQGWISALVSQVENEGEQVKLGLILQRDNQQVNLIVKRQEHLVDILPLDCVTMKTF